MALNRKDNRAVSITCVVIPAQAGIHVYRDVGGRAASGTGRREGETGGVKGWQVLPNGAFDCRACDCHSRCAGMDYVNHWIPAFAGMTVWAGVRHSAVMAEGYRDGDEPTSTPVVIPAKAGIQEGRPGE